MMNVETVLSRTSESDAGDSGVRRHSLSQPSSYHRSTSKQQARHRMSHDPPGVTIQLTPVEAAIAELVPQDVNVSYRTNNTPDNDPVMIAEDQQSTQSTLTGPPTVHFSNQPTDEDWERDHPDPYSNRIVQSSRGGGLDPRKSSITYPKPPPNTVEYDDDSSSLPRSISQQDETPEASENEDDIQNFLQRAYAPDASDDDHIEEEEEDETLSQSVELPKENRNVRSSLDENVHHSTPKSQEPPMEDEAKNSLPSTIDIQKQAAKEVEQREHERQRKFKVPSRSFDSVDDVDSDLTPVMKSPRPFRKGKRNNKKGSKAPTLQSSKPKQKDSFQSWTLSEASSILRSPTFRSAVSKKEKKSKNDTLPSPLPKRKYDSNRKGTPVPSSSKGRISQSIAMPSNNGRKNPITKESKPIQGFRPKPKKDLENCDLKATVQSPTSVLDNLNVTTAPSNTPNPKSSTHDRLPVLQSDSDTSSYQYYGKQPRGRAKKREQNARLLGYDDESSEASSHLFRKSPYGTREEEDRNARLLGYDDDTNTSSSSGLGRHRPFDDSYGSNNDSEDSESNRPGMLRNQGDMPFRQSSPGNNPRLQPQSFSQIPISADMTPEEWEIAQEQIKFLESELDKLASLCLELTKSVDEDDPEGNGNWERAQQQVQFLVQELETVQGLCTMLTQTAKESTDAIALLESDKAMLENLIQKLEQALAQSKDKVNKQHKALEDLVLENESKCCSRCCDWISEPIVWFVSYLYRID